MLTTGFKHKKKIQKFKHGGVVGIDKSKDISILQKGIDSGLLSEEIVAKMKGKIAELSTIQQPEAMTKLIGQKFRPFTSTSDKYNVEVIGVKDGKVLYKHLDNNEEKSANAKDFLDSYITVSSEPQQSEKEYFQEMLEGIKISLKFADADEKAYFTELKKSIEISLKYL